MSCASLFLRGVSQLLEEQAQIPGEGMVKGRVRHSRWAPRGAVSTRALCPCFQCALLPSVTISLKS